MHRNGPLTQVTEWEVEDTEYDAVEDPVIVTDPVDIFPLHPCYLPSNISSDQQVFSVRDRPPPIHHPPQPAS